MGLTSLQVCMDSLSSDWLQGAIHEESGMDCSSPSSGGDMLTCSRPLIESSRRLRPPHDQSLKCPRCDSTHTKFCYYNNYSLSQPRYFCKTCRRYWTKGGTLRNIPVGGGCRKNKKVSKKSSSNNNNENNGAASNSNSNSNSSSPFHHHHNPTDLQLSFPAEVQLSHINTILNNNQGNTFNGLNLNPNFMLDHQNSTNQRPIDNFMESKLEAIVGSSNSSSSRMINNYDFMGNNYHHGLVVPNNNYNHNLNNSQFGMSSGLDHGGNNGSFMDTCQRLMLPYDHHDHDQIIQHHDDHECSIDVKPNTKLLSLEWQDQGYLNNSWSGMINGYGSSTTTNPLV